MRRELKNKAELFDYLMYGYSYELEDVDTKNGKQRRLKDNELGLELKRKVKENIKIEGVAADLKLGVPYNRTSKPWIQIYTFGNRSGMSGRYVGISFTKETNEIEVWVGFGRNTKRKSEILELANQYKIKYSLIEPNLKYDFEYQEDCYDAILIKKKINIKDFNEAEFDRDLRYITNLYKAYEVRFENATVSLKSYKEFEVSSKNKANYEELNKRMLNLIEEVGNLAKAIQNLSSN